ncbi:hypothetical protein ACEPAH_6161 [Sanghuangporus vaninii]
MSTWSGSHVPPPRSERSHSPSRSSFGRGAYPDPYPPDYYHRERDPYDRERGWPDHERGWPGYEYGRRGRSRSPTYDDVGRKRRRSMSPYDRERYDPRPRYDDYGGDPWRGYGHPPPGSRRQHGPGYGTRSGRPPVDPYTLDYPASLKQFAEWFRWHYPKEANEEDQADKAAEQEAADGTKPRNGIRTRWEKYKKDFLAQQLQTLFDHHRKSPWFAEKYDPSSEMTALRARVRKVGWRGRMNQFVNDLEIGEFDKGDACGGDVQSESPKEGSVPADSGTNEEAESPTKPEEDFGMGLENEEDAADNAGDAKNESNGKMSYDSKQYEKDEVSVVPEGNQVMIRTIPPDIGRVKLEAVLKEYSSFVYLALGDPMQKRNYYRAGWIKFDEHADMQNILSTLGEKKIEGFKLHLNHNTRPFTSKARVTPDVASRPDRIAKDLSQARRLATILEDEYERVRTFRPEPPVAQPDATESGDQPPPEDILARDALADDEPPMEKGSDAVERRIARLTADFPEPSDESEAKALELKKNTIALDLYLAYLRAAFHTCYYCVSTCDHVEELQRKCIKHIRRPLPQKIQQQSEVGLKSKEGEPDAKMEGEGEDSEGVKKDGYEEQNKEKEREDKNKDSMLKERDPKSGESKDLKRNDERWLEWLDNKLALLINKDSIDVRDYGGKLYEEELRKAVEPHVKQEDEGKYRCKTCSKLFKATTFIEKHIVNRHSELVRQLEDIPYYNNFVLDPQRIQPFTHYPQQTGTGPSAPPQAYGFQNGPQSYTEHRPGGVGMAVGGGPPFYGFPGPYPPYANGGMDPYGGYQYGFPYPPQAVPPPMRSLRDEPPLMAGNGGGVGGRRLGDRIGGYAADSGAYAGGHGIEGLPAKPVATLEPGPGGRRNGNARGAAPPPPPDAKEDPRAASGRKVSYHDMDLVAEGDVELNY